MNLIKHKKDKISIILILWAVSLVLLTFGLFIVSSKIEKDKIRINEVRNLLKIGEYSEAQEKIKKINQVAAKKLKSQIYIYELLNNGEFLEASEEFSKKFGSVKVSYGNYKWYVDTKEPYKDSEIFFSSYAEGYNFNGYELEEYQMTNTNLKLYMKTLFEAKEFNITYDLDGGENHPDNPNTYTFDDFKLLPAKKYGYIFKGWEIEGNIYDFDREYYYLYEEKDLYVKAVFEKNIIKISFDTNGGEDVSYLKVEVGAEVNLPIPKRKGYVFEGWYYNDQLVESGIWEIEESVNLIAKWKLGVFKLKLNYGYEQDQPTVIDIEHDAYLNLPIPSREGYVFLGWYYRDKQVINKKYSFGTDMEFTAKWRGITYNITLIYEPYKLDYVVTYGEKYSLPTPSRFGYEFVGWYYNDQPIPEKIWGVVGDVEIIAKWKDLRQPISYVLNGGVNDPRNPSKYIPGDADIKIYEPTREGYIFKGWYMTGDTTLNKNAVIKKDSTGEITLYAQWDKIK